MGGETSSRPHVLVVEDDPDIRAMIVQLLELEGFRALSAGDGSEALGMLRAGLRPSVILLDFMMPAMNGWQFRAEQTRDPALADIPVVIITGDGRGVETTRGMGVAGYLKKPIDLDVLLATVARFAGSAQGAS